MQEKEMPLHQETKPYSDVYTQPALEKQSSSNMSSEEKAKESEISRKFYLKYISLFLITVQTSGMVLLIRYASVRPKPERFHTTTAVFFSESVKLIMCIGLVCFESRGFMRGVRVMYDSIIGKPTDTLKVWVPSIIFTFQNNLYYVGVANLDAATFAVTYQLKMLTTALFAVTILRKTLSKMQWFSLVLLGAGVAIVQIQEQKTTSKSAHEQNPLLGFIAVVLVCIMSGFASIYYEKILKTDPASLWMQNVRLALLAIPVSLCTVWVKDGATVSKNGFTYGYDSVVWTIISSYAIGGLMVAMCIKYADNILKGFGQSCAVVISCIASVFLFNFVPTYLFLIGAVFVASSVVLYAIFQ